MPVEAIRVLRLLFWRCVKFLCPLERNLQGPNKNNLIKKTQKESGVSCCTISGGVAPLLRCYSSFHTVMGGKIRVAR